MPGRLALMRPLPFTVASTSAGVTNSNNLLTPDPKEAASLTAGNLLNITLDLGAATAVDMFYVGFLSRPLDSVSVRADNANPPVTIVQGTYTPDSSSSLVNPVYHVPVLLAAPVAARYVTLTLGTPAGAAMTVGVVAAGKSVQPSWGHEYGAGRPLEDTGVAERLFSGGFGIYEGVRVGGYQWTFGDLSDAELEALYALAHNRGQTRSVLVAEDPTNSSGLNERTHWGLFDRLEPYERQVPGASRYAFKVRDWA